MTKRRVEPADDGIVWLSRWEAAWLARVTTESIRKWIEEDLLAETDQRTSWSALHECTERLGHPLAHWTWLNADLTQPQFDAATEAVSTEEVVRLRDEVASVRLDLATAVADAENLDQIAMSYRDSWRRRVQPQSSDDVMR